MQCADLHPGIATLCKKNKLKIRFDSHFTSLRMNFLGNEWVVMPSFTSVNPSVALTFSLVFILHSRIIELSHRTQIIGVDELRPNHEFTNFNN